MLDASAFVGVWPFRDVPERTLDQMIALLRGAGLRGACFTPVEAVLAPEPMGANGRMLTEIVSHSERAHDFVLIAAPVVNPTLPAWRDHVDDCVRQSARVRAVKVFPNYHGVSLDDPAFDRLADHCARRNLALCIQVRMEDERTRHPTVVIPPVDPAGVAGFASRHPRLRILVCGAYMAELRHYGSQPNLHVEMSFVESGRTLRDAVAVMGVRRLLLGTHAPLLMAAAGVSKPRSDDLDDGVDEISGGNFERVFGVA